MDGWTDGWIGEEEEIVAGVGQLDASAASEKLLLRVGLPRAFPTVDTPRGIDSWVHLKNLKQGARYEARVCWAATAPSDFWLSVHSTSGRNEDGSSELYLKISAIAAYYTTNATLMKTPEPVLVDIILDEFLLGALPRSLLNVGFFIVLMASVAWYLGIQIVKWIDAIATKESKTKVT
ncbi:hypothetical protein H072_5057 [Dactylellina haptotyla CBS 200.50]|uniref:Uncharacterized protein n=1 Tax=Dactylellina haptotyla (strain CBS 200.50) TaxID=1284197 RepID=S8BNL1_DACHA|nr:hypothetical protein H072_5057 [Dactylellina haptotyla CBS 200.50]